MALCRTCYGETEYDDQDPRCSRCKSDLQAWRKESQRGSQNELPSSIQSLLSLIFDREAFTYPLSLLVFLVLIVVFALALLLAQSVSLMRVVEAVLLSAVVAFVLYSGRYRLREVRWLRRVKPGSGIPLTYWQMGSFLLAVGLIVGTATLERAWADGSLTLWQSLLLHILVSLIGICLTISWTLTVVGGYLSGLDERVPQPIFMDMNTLSDLALDAAGSRLGVRSWEILAIQRTNDGGLKINVRQKGTKKTASAAAKAATGTARTSWTVVCDRWGRLRSVLPNQGSVL